MLLETHQEEKLITQLFGNQPDSVVWFTPVFSNSNSEKLVVDFEPKYCNAAACNILGAQPKDIIGVSVLSTDLMDEISRNRIFEQCLQVWKTEEPFEFTYYSSKFDKHFNVQRSKVMNGILSITRDRTREVKAELERERQAKLLDSILNSSLNGVYALQALRNNTGEVIDFTVTHVNKVFCTMSGKEAVNVIGKSYLNLFPNLKHSGVFERNCNVLATGIPIRQEVHYQGGNLDTWYDASVVKIDEDSLVISFNDITGIKRSSEHIRQIIDSAQTGICLLAPVRNEINEIIDFKVLVANKKFTTYTADPLQDATGKHVGDYFPSYKEKGSTFEMYCDTFYTGMPGRQDMHYTGEGLDLWMDVTSIKMDENVLVTFHDYTPIKRLQQQLEQSVFALKKSNERLSEFTHVASHDLNEPLRKIMTFTQLLSERYDEKLDAGAKDYLKRIHKTSQRMQMLINDLLTYSQLNKKIEEFKSVSLNAVIKEVISDLETSITEKQASIQVAQLPIIKGDQTQLRQVFQNLISNSLKFNKPSEQPKISITASEVIGTDPTVALLVPDKNSSYNVIEVADEGIGFDQSDAERIFQLFQRLHGRHEYEGTGIGLAIVQKAMDNHFGFVQVESEPEKGARFKLFFPLT